MCIYIYIYIPHLAFAFPSSCQPLGLRCLMPHSPSKHQEILGFDPSRSLFFKGANLPRANGSPHVS